MKSSMIFFLITLFFMGCSSLNGKNSELTSSTVQNLGVGQASKDEVLKKLGSPAEKEFSAQQETWIYPHPQTGAQRVSLSFSRADGILQSVLWVPQPEEREASLETLFVLYPRDHFKEIPSKGGFSHELPTMVSYVNEAKGMTVLYQTARKQVEALVWTNPQKRTPALYKEKPLNSTQ